MKATMNTMPPPRQKQPADEVSAGSLKDAPETAYDLSKDKAIENRHAPLVSCSAAIISGV